MAVSQLLLIRSGSNFQHKLIAHRGTEQTLCTQARAIKSKFLKISNIAFLLIYLLLVYLCLCSGHIIHGYSENQAEH
jgi:hypothetical protein